MAAECNVLADSVSDHGFRLTTFEITVPRIILAEINTHRMLSRNSASSRAIPIDRAIEAIERDMFVPIAFGKNQKVLQADVVVAGDDATRAAGAWRRAGLKAVGSAHVLKGLGVHKAWANRVLEPYKWHTAIVTATEWDNFFALRTHKDAQPEFREIALMMQDAYQTSTPRPTYVGEWHTPLISAEDRYDASPQRPDRESWQERLNQISIGRCARVSIEQHDGTRSHDADVKLHSQLKGNGHLSPFEHVARPFNTREWTLVYELHEFIRWSQATRDVDHAHGDYLIERVMFKGNLRGWHSARMDVPHEDNYGKVLDAIR